MTNNQRMFRPLASVLIVIMLCSCATRYAFVPEGKNKIRKAGIIVTTNQKWSMRPSSLSVARNEVTWTKNGPRLDAVTFLGRINDGEAIVKQRESDERQVAPFRATMTPPELAAMIESYYRVKLEAAVFDVTSVSPIEFLGTGGVQVDYTYVREDEVLRRGRCAMSVVENRLFVMMLTGAKLHYFELLEAEFAALIASAEVL